MPFVMKILVTAFEPFGADDKNASLEVLKRLSAPEGCELIKAVVPVVFGKACIFRPKRPVLTVN